MSAKKHLCIQYLHLFFNVCFTSAHLFVLFWSCKFVYFVPCTCLFGFCIWVPSVLKKFVVGCLPIFFLLFLSNVSCCIYLMYIWLCEPCCARLCVHDTHTVARVFVFVCVCRAFELVLFTFSIEIFCEIFNFWNLFIIPNKCVCCNCVCLLWCARLSVRDTHTHTHTLLTYLGLSWVCYFCCCEIVNFFNFFK